MEDGEKFYFTGFYGQTEPILRQQAWDMLRRVKSTVNEGWIVGGDFNAILNDFEKEGGRRKPRALMDEFGDILKELSLTDAKERKARDIISNIWTNEDTNLLEKIELIRERLGPWQYQRYRRMKYKLKSLGKDISRLTDGNMSDRSTNLLKKPRSKLSQLYDVEEQHWATRSRSQWLREGDRNTRYFHVRAPGRRKKNSIEKLKEVHENWHVDNKEIYHVAWDYFNDLFKTSINSVEESDL
ncbi:uncharacterized protein LOC128039943 [Gossypium raimondii]|uniref:uncharacterized protein LOC128039943 n=1 Tax=Gossypium raimondii TaxID=29730 RepID=UPI00227C5BC7|nr:uncharacterized protein LOC128039943 [Gossypium raimondii]